MSNINVLALYQQKQREFSCEGAGLVRFQNDFVSATNRAIRRINLDADLSSPIAEISDVNPSSVIGLDTAYEQIVSDIITVELIKMGQRPQRKEFELTYKNLVESLPEQIDMIRSKILNEEQDADTDEETTYVGMNRHP